VPSPDHEYLAEDGWVWHPLGMVMAWSLRRWLGGNVWESEDGPSKKVLCHRNYFWDGPLCWLGPRRLTVWGQGDDEQELVPAVRIFDVTTGQEERWFSGPKGELFFDELLFSCDKEEGTAVWDDATGERILHDGDVRPLRYHRSAKTFLTVLPGGRFRISRLVGTSFDPAWRTSSVVSVATGIAAGRSFADLPVLADALEEAGCSDEALLEHCRRPGPHGQECWAVARVLGE
jgi:hypothetical protein